VQGSKGWDLFNILVICPNLYDDAVSATELCSSESSDITVMCCECEIAFITCSFPANCKL
jgi:hypothetical protein